MDLKDLIKDCKLTVRTNYKGIIEVLSYQNEGVVRTEFTSDELEKLEHALTDLNHAIMLFRRACV